MQFHQWMEPFLRMGVSMTASFESVTTTSAPSTTSAIATSTPTSTSTYSTITESVAEVAELAAVSSVAASQTSTSTTSAATPSSTACGYIVNSGYTLYNSSIVYECLTSVPFNAAVATRFINYYNDTIQFHSTLAYLKSPPPSYQQPSLDLVAELGRLQQGIDAGVFANQYEFEVALQKTVYAAHDSHLYLYMGILNAFSFAAPMDLTTVSLDGVSEPKVYFISDLFDSNYFTTYQPSAIELINGVDVVDYLTEYAANQSYGSVEPHTDWNMLMQSAAQDILGYYDIFVGDSLFYPGDSIEFKMENGSSYPLQFQAIYFNPGDTGDLATGGDFYNYFVLGQFPASWYEEEDDDDSYYDNLDDGSDDDDDDEEDEGIYDGVDNSITPGWGNAAYPDPDVEQEDLGTYGGGFISGYFLNDSSIAVLSIPSFEEWGGALNTFQSTIAEFLERSQAAGLEKVVIDLQQNSGGQPLLAMDTFQQFFPDVIPYAGSRMRAHDNANTMGSTLTGTWDSLNETHDWYEQLAANEWVVTDRINAATHQNFTSWAQFFGPNSSYSGDSYTSIQQYNISSNVFIDDSSDESEFNITKPDASPAPYSAENVIILTDGVCASSCSLFVEMMSHEAGVRVVTVGGRPVAGPMQACSGTRGARAYDIETLDENIAFTDQLLEADNSPLAGFMGDRSSANDIQITSSGFNLRDQVRGEDQIPLQFAYMPADCRIYYTPQTVYNYTNLWKYAADAMWNNATLCVAGSTGLNTTLFDEVASEYVSSGSGSGVSSGLQQLLDTINNTNTPTDGTEDDYVLPWSNALADGVIRGYKEPTECTSRDNCTTTKYPKKKDWVCVTSNTECNGLWGNKSSKTKGICVSACSTSSKDTTCHTDGAAGKCQSKGKTATFVGNKSLQSGYCQVTAATTCATWKKAGTVNGTTSGPAAGEKAKREDVILE